MYTSPDTIVKNQNSYLNKEILTAEETADFLGISKNYLYKLTHHHEIPYYRPNGKLIYFERADLMAWMRRNRVATEAETKDNAIGYIIGK